MSQDSPMSTGGSVPQVPPVIPEATPEKAARVILVSYPKIMFLYPTVLTALFCGIVMWVKGGMPMEEVRSARMESAEPAYALASLQPDEAPEATAAESGSTADATAAEAPAASGHSYHYICARLFLFVLTVNLVVISFDFPRTTSLTWFFALVSVAIGLWLLFTRFPGLAPEIFRTLSGIRPAANATFYFIFVAAMFFLYVCVLVSRRFDYWEVKGNELLHHHGFLSNLERFNAPNLRIDKEINDLFEYILLRAGRLIIHCSNERRAIVLDNVLFINEKEEQITRMLGALQVRVNSDKE